MDNGDVLKTFYELGAGLTPSVVTVRLIIERERNELYFLCSIERNKSTLWRLETSSSCYIGQSNRYKCTIC